MQFKSKRWPKPKPRDRRQHGLSLVELMVAITLGLLLTGGMLQLFESSKVTFNTNDAVARVQENGRFAMEILKRELRSAGTHGFCAGRMEINNHLNPSCGGGAEDFFDPNRAITGWEFGGTGFGDEYELPADLSPGSAQASDWDSSAASGSSLPGLLQGLVVPGSDVLVTRRLEVLENVTAAGNTPKNANSINLNQGHGLPDDSIVLVTNCATGADLFQNVNNGNATSFSAGVSSCNNPGPGNVNGLDWATAYDESMQSFAVVVVAYYIGVNQNTGQPGLYRLNMSAGTSDPVTEELVEGAENLQILYGFSEAAPSGDGQSVDRWLRADQVPANGWQQIIALRLGLSVRSPDFADRDETNITFDLAGAEITALGDGRMRQPFSVTIALRNRLIVI